MAKQTPTENVKELERLMKKVLNRAFKDNTLDYTIQIAITSVEPGTVKYGFMINGMKKEIQPIAMSWNSYAECKAVLEGLLVEVDTVKLEQMFHLGRINVYKNAITSHEDRLEQIEKGETEDDDIEMEQV